MTTQARDFSTRLDELQERVAAVRSAVQAAAAESRGAAQAANRTYAGRPAPGWQDAQQKATQAADSARSKWAEMKADAATKMEDVKAKIDKRTRELDAKDADFDADWSEADAPDALDFPEWAVDNAQWAMFDAIDARAYADEVAKAASS